MKWTERKAGWLIVAGHVAIFVRCFWVDDRPTGLIAVVSLLAFLTSGWRLFR